MGSHPAIFLDLGFRFLVTQCTKRACKMAIEKNVSFHSVPKIKAIATFHQNHSSEKPSIGKRKP
jgi:hypothetical protein